VDRAYLARDVNGVRTKIGGTDTAFEHFGFLAVGASYERTGTIRVPNDVSGDVYVVVHAADPLLTRDNPVPFEFTHGDNNTGSSAAVAVALSASADLMVVGVTAPPNAKEGEAIDVIWTVKNDGLASASGSWVDSVYLEPTGAGVRIALGTYRYDGPLDAGKTYTRHELVRLPDQFQGVYKVVVVTNP